MVQLVDLLDVQLRNLTPGGKDSAARSLNKVSDVRARGIYIKIVPTFKVYVSNGETIQSSSPLKLEQWECIWFDCKFLHTSIFFCFCLCFVSFCYYRAFNLLQKLFSIHCVCPPPGFLLTWKSRDLRGVGALRAEIIFSYTFPIVSLPELQANLFIRKRAQFWSALARRARIISGVCGAANGKSKHQWNSKCQSLICWSGFTCRGTWTPVLW